MYVCVCSEDSLGGVTTCASCSDKSHCHGLQLTDRRSKHLVEPLMRRCVCVCSKVSLVGVTTCASCSDESYYHGLQLTDCRSKHLVEPLMRRCVCVCVCALRSPSVV